MAKISGLPPTRGPGAAPPPEDAAQASARPRFVALPSSLNRICDTVGLGLSRFLNLAPDISGFDNVVQVLNDAASMFRLNGPASKEMRQWVVEALKQQEEFIGRKGSV